MTVSRTVSGREVPRPSANARCSNGCAVHLAQICAPDSVIVVITDFEWCQLEPLPEELHGELIFKSLESFADTSAGAGFMATRSA